VYSEFTAQKKILGNCLFSELILPERCSVKMANMSTVHGPTPLIACNFALFSV
jgi:hypothetical protein